MSSSNITTQTMTVSTDHYYRLASELPNERIEAVISLFKDLNSSNSKDDWVYALNRLVKGLITTRQSARFGFSMALVEVIRELINRDSPEYQEFTVVSFLELVLSTTQVKASMKGKEERSVLFGRLFGLQILINSRVLFDTSLVSKEGEQILFKFVSSLVELSTLKSWLRETAIFTLCQFISQLNESELSSPLKESVLSAILQSTNDQGLNLSTEGIAIYLSIPKAQRSDLVSTIKNPKANWKNGDPFSKGNLPILSKALKDVEVIEDEEENAKNKNSKQKGSWSPRLPFVWISIISSFNEESETDEGSLEEDSKKRKKSSSSKSKKKKQTTEAIALQEFWKVVVDETLFSDKSSHERKYWGFEIFCKFVESLQDHEQVQHLFTNNFMRCLINQSSQSNRFLNKIATKSLDQIVMVSKSNFLKAPVILKKLLDETNGGCWNFDLVTKSKTVDSLISILNDVDSEKVKSEEIELVLSEIKDILLKTFHGALEAQDEDEGTETHKKPNDNILKWSLDKLLLLIRNSKHLLLTKKSSSNSGKTIIKSKFIEDILKLLIKLSFFTRQGHKNVSTNIKKLCQERLNSIISDVISIKRKDSSWPYFCIKYILKTEDSNEYMNLIDFEGELLDIKKDTVKKIKSIHEDSKQGSKEEFGCFELLFSMVLLQLYSGDDESLAVIDDLKFCYDDFLKSSDSSQPKEEQTSSSVVLTEIIMSFLSRKSGLLKKLSMIIWESVLCVSDSEGVARVDEESLKSLLNVLVEKENKEGQQNLFDSVNDSDVEENDEEDDDNMDEEDEHENEDEDDEDDEDEDDEDEEGDGENDDAEDDDDVAALDKETNLKLAQALGIPTSGTGEVKFDELSSDDEEESDMDDEAMMAMDDQLAKIFKERHDAMASMSSGSKRKAEVVEAKEQMIFFKSKILDLLDIFTKAQPHSELNMLIVEPIVVLIHLTMDKNLQSKAHKYLKTRLSKCLIDREQFLQKDVDAQQEFVQSNLQTLKELQKRAGSKKPNQAHTLACNQACIVLSKNIVHVKPEETDAIIDIYSQSMKKWANKPSNKIQASMFFDFINWLNSKRS